MTPEQRIQRVIENMDRRVLCEDQRPWWKRFVSSLRVKVKLNPSVKKPIKQVEVSAGVEF